MDSLVAANFASYVFLKILKQCTVNSNKFFQMEVSFHIFSTIKSISKIRLNSATGWKLKMKKCYSRSRLRLDLCFRKKKLLTQRYAHIVIKINIPSVYRIGW